MTWDKTFFIYFFFMLRHRLFLQIKSPSMIEFPKYKVGFEKKKTSKTCLTITLYVGNMES